MFETKLDHFLPVSLKVLEITWAENFYQNIQTTYNCHSQTIDIRDMIINGLILQLVVYN